MGTGYYPANAALPASTRLTLLDLNAASLDAAQRRLGRATTQQIQHDVLTPLPTRAGKDFDAVSMFYLLHCLPGKMARKAAVSGHLKSRLAEGGVLYGATILGKEAGHNGFGRRLMALYNRKGVFGNGDDTRDELERALQQHFLQVTIRVEG